MKIEKYKGYLFTIENPCEPLGFKHPRVLEILNTACQDDTLAVGDAAVCPFYPEFIITAPDRIVLAEARDTKIGQDSFKEFVYSQLWPYIINWEYNDPVTIEVTPTAGLEGYPPKLLPIKYGRKEYYLLENLRRRYVKAIARVKLTIKSEDTELLRTPLTLYLIRGKEDNGLIWLPADSMYTVRYVEAVLLDILISIYLQK